MLQTSKPTREEPHNQAIHETARNGLKGVGHHGSVSAMGVPLVELPRWDDIQLLTAQLARRPLADDDPVNTELVIGPRAEKPLRLRIPIFVSDMSFGALSEEAKRTLAKGAEMAGTGTCSGEGGMLPEEQQSNGRYFYELASGKFGWSLDRAALAQAFHFKGGQGAKTGTRRNLPGVAAQVRERTGGIPVGFKMSAQHIEDDIDFALEVGVDYIILDGRGGATGAAPDIFKNNISVPTIPALARARLRIGASARQLANYLEATVELMEVLARACGHDRLSEFSVDDLTTWKREMADLAGIPYAGIGLQQNQPGREWRTLEESNPQPSDP